MTLTQESERSREFQLRVWPGVVAVGLQWFLRYVVPIFAPDALLIAVFGGIGLALAVLVWWLFFSRAPQVERWGALVLIVAAMAATRQIVDPSIATGMMGMMLIIYSVPVLCLALVVAALAGRRFATGPRRVTMAAIILAACGVWALLRTDGMTASARSHFAWRWAQTSEQKLLAHEPIPAAPPPTPKPETAEPPTPESREVPVRPAAHRSAVPVPRTAAHSSAVWPGFRGPHRDDVVAGVRIKTDWSSSPPVELWRHAVGPGWSSFAVRDGLLYTQEQRGEFEAVTCYDLATGAPVWTHRDKARFWESNAGAGPRGTPTLEGRRVYTFGATGILNALDAATGAVVWTRNAAADTGTKTPDWGFSSSPLVVNDEVIIATSGRLAAYDLATGNPRWTGPAGKGSYSSAHLIDVGGVPQVMLLTGDGALSVAPGDGAVLWKHAWPGFAILQPAVVAGGGVLIANTDGGTGAGTRRLDISRGPDGWTAKEAWTSRGLKPYFNDIVVHNGHAYGFDGSMLSCIDLQDGKRVWKGGRYGNGQLLLLADQDLLLVVSEEGEMVLVAAVPGQFTEVARARAIEGKTWNHPVLAGDTLLVRNGEEMAAFRLALAAADESTSQH